MRRGAIPAIMLIVAGCAGDPERAAFDAETSRQLATLPPQDLMTYLKIADALAEGCPTVERRADVPSEAAMQASLSGVAQPASHEGTIELELRDRAFARALSGGAGVEGAIGSRACEIAAAEIAQGTLPGRLLVAAE